MPSCIAFLAFAITFASSLYAAKKSTPLIKRIDIASSTSFSLPIAGDGDKTIKERAGVALSLRDADFRLYEATDAISLTNGTSFLDSLNSPLWGAGVNFQELLGIPLSVQAGTLNTGGSLSRLRNPEITNPSLFSSTFSLPIGAEVSLPSLSSSDKPAAISILSQAVSGIFSTRAQAIANEDDLSAASLSFMAKLPRMMKTGICVTGGFFPIEDKKTHSSAKSWYSYTPYFADCLIAAGSFQTYFDCPAATCIFTGNIYQQPEREAALTGRGEAALRADIFSLRTGIFLVNKPLPLDSEGAYIKKTFQLMAQPAVTFHPSSTKLSALSFGASAFLQRYDDEGSKGTLKEYTVMKAAAGARYSDNKFTSQGTFSINNIPITGKSNDTSTKYTSYQAAASGSITAKKKIKHTVRASVSITPDTEAKTAAAGYSITVPKKAVRITSGASLEANRTNDGIDALSASASFKAVITKKPLRIILKMEAKSKIAQSK